MDHTDPVAARAAVAPRSPAVELPYGAASWAELEAGVDIAARRLAALGVRPRDRVVLIAEPGLPAAEIIYALPRLGAVLVPLAPQDPATRHLAARAEARLVVRPEELERVRPARTSPELVPGPDEPRTLIFTSGSTGEPKGVLLSFENHSASANASAGALRLLPSDKWLACLPLNHIGGLSIFVRAAEIGFCVAPVAGFEAPEVIERLASSEATAVSLVPTMLIRMLDEGWEPHPPLRFVLLGGAPASSALIERAEDAGVPVAPTYGMTETCSQVTTLPPWERPPSGGTAGRPLPGMRVVIGDSPHEPFETGERGQIWVSGPAVARETYTGPIPLVDGWLATGDVGTLDELGYLSVLGRLDEVIVTGGENVAPQEVEAALMEHPAVSEAVVLGVPDAQWGRRVVAVVVPVRGGDFGLESLKGFLRQRLAGFKVPKEFLVVEDLPRTPAGKVDRTALRHALEGGSGG